MRPLTPILYKAAVAGKPVRFVASPLPGPDFPWHAAEDLFVALRFPGPVRREFQQRLQGSFGSEVRTVATAGGIATVCPHYMAQGAIAAGIEIGCSPVEAEFDYARAAAGAMTALADGLGLQGIDRIAYAAEAFKRGER